MFGKSSQYVNILKYYNQLKLDYKQLSNDDIVKVEHATFLLSGDVLPENVVFKLKSLEKNDFQTYFSTLCDTKHQKLYLKADKADADTNVVVELNSDYNIALDKSTLFETKHYYESCGIDYIYSPFHILNLHCEQNPSGSSITGLILNNSLYLLILNEQNQIVYYSIESLTAFEEIQKSNFYDNEIFGQKLFDEIYYFEIENIISTVLAKFYETKEKTFIERVTILHMVKQLNDEQIHTLHKELLIEVNYHPISIDDYMYELSKQKAPLQKSFIKPRVKKKSHFAMITSIFIFIITLCLGAYVYNFIHTQKELVREQNRVEKIKKQEVVEVKKVEVVKPPLPNHVTKNGIILKRVLNLFELIPYNVVLDELTLDATSSKMLINLLQDDIYIRSMQPNLLKLYKDSQIVFEDPKATVLKATISNDGFIDFASTMQEVQPAYLTNEFLPKQRVEEKIKELLGEMATFEFKSDFKSEVTTFNYGVTVLYKEPKEFFDLIEKLNREFYSVNISYPITMKKAEYGIETNFILQFHQNY